MSPKITLLTILLLSVASAKAYYPYSPYVYCVGNPINYVDPNGCEIRGNSKKDAAIVVEDIRVMFPGDEFANFRDLIVQSGKKQNGKSLATITSDALSSAFCGVNLNEYQQALVDLVVGTINSTDIYSVEYLTPDKEMSPASLEVYEPMLNSMGITSEMAENTNGGYSQYVFALYGEGATTLTPNGSLSLILKNSDYFVTNRPATLGHEVIGHGRSLRLGYTDVQLQHVIPIQVENLILRNMGIQFFRNGSDHVPLNTIIPNYNSIPIIR